MAQDQISYGTASGEYAIGTPKALQAVLVPVSVADTPGIDTKTFPAKPEPFFIQCKMFATSSAALATALGKWNTEQGTAPQTLTLRGDGWDNVQLMAVSPQDRRKTASASDGQNWQQTINLQFIQLS
jgi:hypothetical protein